MNDDYEPPLGPDPDLVPISPWAIAGAAGAALAVVGFGTWLVVLAARRL